MRKTLRQRFNFYDIFAYLFCGLFAVICFYPLWFVFVGSITPSRLGVQQSLRILPPMHPTFEYYSVILQTKMFQQSLLISFIKTIIGTVSTLIFTGMMAYGVSKKHIPGMKALNFLAIFFIFFNGGLIPTYVLYNSMSLLKTFWVMVIPTFINLGSFVIMRNYFSYTVSPELEDAAVIDGANEVIIFFKIVVPISMPMFAAIFLFEAVFHWNDWTSYLYYVGKPSLMPFIVVLQELLRNPNGYLNAQTDFGGLVSTRQLPPASLVNSTIVIAMLPILMLYPFLQKHFAKGIVIGAVKG